MNQNFIEAMSKKTDEQLVEIVQVKMDEYQPEAIEAAKKELEERQITPERIERVKQGLTENEIEKNEFELRKVSSFTRLIHFIIDLIGLFVVAIILGVLVSLFVTSSNESTYNAIGYLLTLISFFLYYVYLEYKYQKTLGKFLTKTTVVMNDGRKPELNEIFIRTACRLIPFDRISYLFTKNGFHDRLSNTTVVKDEQEKN